MIGLVEIYPGKSVRLVCTFYDNSDPPVETDPDVDTVYVKFEDPEGNLVFDWTLISSKVGGTTSTYEKWHTMAGDSVPGLYKHTWKGSHAAKNLVWNDPKKFMVHRL